MDRWNIPGNKISWFFNILFQIQDFPGMLNFYHISVIQFFKSNWSEVRAGAAMFIGMSSSINNNGINNNDWWPHSGNPKLILRCVLPGFLLGNLSEEHLSHLNMGSVTKGEALHNFPKRKTCVNGVFSSRSGLVMLLQDPDPVVRVKAAEAMGHFHWPTRRSLGTTRDVTPNVYNRHHEMYDQMKEKGPKV